MAIVSFRYTLRAALFFLFFYEDEPPRAGALTEYA
jgi:hypothetical protein